MSEIVFCIGEEHFIFIRIRTVSRVRKPEILPHHYAMAVAGLVKFCITSLSHPVAHDCEVHVRVVIDSYVIFPSTIVQIVLTESPVASTADESTAVDIKMQDTAFFVSIYLPDADLEGYSVR